MLPGLFDFNPLNVSLGFEDVVTIDMLREAYPVLDVVDHSRRPKDGVSRKMRLNLVAVCTDDIILTVEFHRFHPLKAYGQ